MSHYQLSSDQMPTDPDLLSAYKLLCEKRDGKGRGELKDAFAIIDKHGVVRIYDCYLKNADLTGLMLFRKNLRDSNLDGANLSDARFDQVGFDGSCLTNVNFEEAILKRVDLRRVTGLSGAHWDEVILDGARLPKMELVGKYCSYDKTGPDAEPRKASYVYRTLKEAFRREGDGDASGHYYYQEMQMKRSLAGGSEKIWYTALWALAGYGERPMRAIGTFLTSCVGFALLYQLVPGVVRWSENSEESISFFDCLYFSIITLTTTGYGDLEPIGIGRLLASLEAFTGIFTIALFVFVFCRRMIR